MIEIEKGFFSICNRPMRGMGASFRLSFRGHPLDAAWQGRVVL